MKIPIYTKAPAWWTSEEWNMSEKERKLNGIDVVYIDVEDKEYNPSKSVRRCESKRYAELM